MPSPPVILCVDDDPDVLQMTGRVLEIAGFSVLAASSGAEALRIASRNHLDAVVLDYSMPGMDGAAVAVELRNRTPRVPIVFFTGSPDLLQEDVLRLADACVFKGGPVFDLADLVRELLRRLNRRQFTRRPIAAPIAVGLHRPGAAPRLSGRTFDLSEAGFGGRLDGTLLPGQVVTLAIQLPNTGEPVSSTARVAYRNGENHGFQFLALPDAARESIVSALSSE